MFPTVGVNTHMHAPYSILPAYLPACLPAELEDGTGS